MTGGGAAQPRACVGCRGADGTPLIQRGGRGSQSREPAMEKHVRPRSPSPSPLLQAGADPRLLCWMPSAPQVCADVLSLPSPQREVLYTPPPRLLDTSVVSIGGK